MSVRNGNRGISQTPSYHPQLTDKQLAEMRGVLDRGLLKDGPTSEPLDSILDFEHSCTAEIRIEPISEESDPAEIRRLIVLGGTYATFRNSTPCLLKIASILERSVSNELFLKAPESFFSLVGQIADISEVIVGRTKASYRLFADAQQYQPLDRRVLSINPVKDYRNWKSLYDQRKQIMAGRALVSTPTRIEEEPIKLNDKEAWQDLLDRIEKGLDSTLVASRLAAASTGDMPEVNKRIENLKILKFSDIEAQTRARYSRAVRDDSVHDHVELMIYHSVYSVLLDKKGNPAFLAGFPYAFIIPRPGLTMERQMQPPGLSVATGKLADYQLAVDGRKVKSILFGGVGALVETLSTFSWEHELHTQLQRYIDFNGFYAVPVITVREAFGAGELSISAAYSKMPEIIDRTSGYVVAEIFRRLENLYENYEEILLAVPVDAVRDIVVGRVKEWVRNFLINKIGKKLIPGVNLISLIADLRDEDGIEMIRAAVASVVMSVKSTRTDDLTISAKVLAKIGVDKVQEKVVQELAKRAGKKLIKKAQSAVESKAKSQPKPETPKPELKPDTPAAQPDAGAAKKPDAPAATDPKVARGTADPRTQHRNVPTREDIEQGRRIGEQITKAQAKAKADAAAAQKRRQETKPTDAKPTDDKPADPKATGAPAVDSKATHGKSTDSTTTQAKGSDVRGTPKKKKDPPPEPPVPPSSATAKERLEFFQKNKKHYPKDIQDRIDAEAAKAAGRKPGGVGVKAGADINKDIEAENAKGGKQYPPIPKNVSAEDRLEYLKQNRSKYPPEVRKKIDAQIEKSAQRDASAGSGSLGSIDAAIREDHARVLTIHYGIPIDRVKRREQYSKGENNGEDKPGTDTEKTNIAERTGKRSQLSAVSKTKDGEEVEIDDLYVDDQGKFVAREYKSSLDIKQKPPRRYSTILKRGWISKPGGPRIIMFPDMSGSITQKRTGKK